MCKRTAIYVLKLTTYRHTMGNATDANIDIAQLFSNVVSSRFTLYRWVGCQH
jgi:hypothetical protein